MTIYDSHSSHAHAKDIENIWYVLISWKWTLHPLDEERNIELSSNEKSLQEPRANTLYAQ